MTKEHWINYFRTCCWISFFWTWSCLLNRILGSCFRYFHWQCLLRYTDVSIALYPYSSKLDWGADLLNFVFSSWKGGWVKYFLLNCLSYLFRQLLLKTVMLLGGCSLSFVGFFLIFIYLAENFWGKKSCWSNAPCVLLWVHLWPLMCSASLCLARNLLMNSTKPKHYVQLLNVQMWITISLSAVADMQMLMLSQREAQIPSVLQIWKWH